MPTTDVLGVPHAYDLTAPTPSSDVLVFIHGWLLSRSYWQPLIERLATDYQCLSYDLRGFGYSQPCRSPLNRQSVALSDLSSQVVAADLIMQTNTEHLSRPSSLPEDLALSDSLTTHYNPIAYARDLAELLRQLNIASAWLVGHSLGGTIALWAADLLPQQIKGVICLNAGGGIYLKEEFERFRNAGQQILKLRPRWLCYLPLLDLLFTRANVVQAIARTWGRQRVIDFVRAEQAAALGSLLDCTTETEVHRLPQVVSRLKQPIYFFAGAQDPIMEPKYVRHLASFHPTFGDCCENVVEIPNCGHLAMLEQPEIVATEMRTILTKHSEAEKPE